MKEVLKFHISKTVQTRQEGTFYVPSACKQLSFQHDLSEPFTFLIFVIIKDPKKNMRFQKQLAHSEPIIQLSELREDTTIGGIPGKIEAGDWTMEIIIFAEHIEDYNCDIKIDFSFEISDRHFHIQEFLGENVWVNQQFVYEKYDDQKRHRCETKWYKGDLHTHTRLSDGKETPQRANEKSKQMGLDYYVPTEHNVVHTGWPKTDVMIVPGVELTSILGHANLFGIDRRPEQLTQIMCHKTIEELEADYRQIIEVCRKRDWIFSINHPFLYVWKWNFKKMELTDLQCLEINNDPTYEADAKADAKIANQKAVLLADMLWEDGYRICAIGGSDSHNRIEERYGNATEPSIPGDPATYLYMHGLSPVNLKAALKECSCYVTRHCEIETNLLFGSVLKDDVKTFWFTIRLSGVIEKPIFYYIHNSKKVICDLCSEPGAVYIASGCINLTEEEYQWIRFGAETQTGDFLFYGNPITKGKKIHQYKYYGEIREKLEERWKLKEYYLTKTEQS